MNMKAINALEIPGLENPITIRIAHIGTQNGVNMKQHDDFISRIDIGVIRKAFFSSYDSLCSVQFTSSDF